MAKLCYCVYRRPSHARSTFRHPSCVEICALIRSLQYGNSSSWGLAYNLYSDKLLKFDLFPQSVYEYALIGLIINPANEILNIGCRQRGTRTTSTHTACRWILGASHNNSPLVIKTRSNSRAVQPRLHQDRSVAILRCQPGRFSLIAIHTDWQIWTASFMTTTAMRDSVCRLASNRLVCARVHLADTRRHSSSVA